jgi:hypothetical protein
MRVLVCGGRDYHDYKKVSEVLGDLYYSLSHEEQNCFVLISGGARGADTLARRWAQNYLPGFSFMGFRADWKSYGLSAGPKRNAQMLEEGKPDLVLAFPGGKGTADMVKKARAAKVKVEEIDG